MAQTLKDDVRQAIIEAAKQEFLLKGYKGASMRSIAKKANMTVGNLYRYYKSKEDINLSIVAPTFRLIDSALKNLSNDNVSLEPRVFNIKPNISDVINNFDNFADSLVKVYTKNKSEFNILFLHSRVSEEMISKFVEVINELMSQHYVYSDISDENQLLAKAYGEALFSGLKTIFKDNNVEEIDLKRIIKTYFRTFLNMLDKDINKYE